MILNGPLSVNNVLTQAPFYFSDGIDGSTTSYTITYSDSTSGRICGSATIPASSCDGGICSCRFDISSSSCLPSADVSVTVFASNILGNGPMSEPRIMGT